MKNFFFIAFFVMTHLPASKPPPYPIYHTPEKKPGTPFHQKFRTEEKRLSHRYFKANTATGASLYILQNDGERRYFDNQGNELFD